MNAIFIFFSLNYISTKVHTHNLLKNGLITPISSIEKSIVHDFPINVMKTSLAYKWVFVRCEKIETAGQIDRWGSTGQHQDRIG